MQFYFIRHAQSSNNALYDSTGSWDGRSADPELTEMGWQQARALADYLQRSPADPQAAGRDAANHGGFGITRHGGFRNGYAEMRKKLQGVLAGVAGMALDPLLRCGFVDGAGDICFSGLPLQIHVKITLFFQRDHHLLKPVENGKVDVFLHG